MWQICESLVNTYIYVCVSKLMYAFVLPILLLLLLLELQFLVDLSIFQNLTSTALGPATYASISSGPCSLDLPQLTEANSTRVFLHVEYFLVQAE